MARGEGLIGKQVENIFQGTGIGFKEFGIPALLAGHGSESLSLDIENLAP